MDWIGTRWIGVDFMPTLPVIVVIRFSLILGVKLTTALCKLLIWLIWECLYLVCLLGGAHCLVDDLLNVFLVDLLLYFGLLVLLMLIAV